MRWSLVFAAAGILLITTGTRQSLGLFIAPLNIDTGVSLVAISFALAVGQLAWGAVQPLFGALAGRHGSRVVLTCGLLLMTGGLAAAAFARSEAALIATLGVLSATGAGAASFAILIGAVAGRLPAERRSFAAGVINAGASLGQFVFAPIAQALIGFGGWAFALLALAASTLLALPLVGALRGGGEPATAAPAASPGLR
ncbi:MAG: MFS transporter, partial [Gammaproteobacteria bacterium]|nr:MFS transporter [Gammaproteobacteria bacterium]